MGKFARLTSKSSARYVKFDVASPAFGFKFIKFAASTDKFIRHI
ncbi:hypothetical protein [uncultured Campylobacter sp.]|nr:hypothetical protein [uncultured Campylobacter sp.]